MIRIERFVNELMSSNCYIVWDDVKKHTIVVDPASEKSLKEITFIIDNDLILDYIILTHEHTDHTWGVNALLVEFPDAKVLCTEECKKKLPNVDQAYFSFYMDAPDYEYYVRRVDVTTEEIEWALDWQGHQIRFEYTPGHSIACMCFSIENMLFTGDTIMSFKPFIKKKNGGSWKDYKDSISRIRLLYSADTLIFPGHGACFILKDFDA